jgi:hypothetical protein
MLEHTDFDVDILKRTSDCTIIYKSRLFPCSKYICGRLSSLLRSLLEIQDEGIDEHRDEGGLPVYDKITLPDNERLHVDALETVLNLMHSNENVYNLDDCPKFLVQVIDSADYLGCPEGMRTQLVEQLWAVTFDDPIAIQANLSLFVHESILTKDVLTQLFFMWPHWGYWKTHLLKHMGLDATSFRRVALLLAFVFPASDVFRACLEACRHSNLVLAMVVETYTRLAVYMHPMEIADTMTILSNYMRQHGHESIYIDALEATKNALSVYYTVPSSVADAYGTTIMFERRDVVSCCILLEGTTRKHILRRIDRWGTVMIDRNVNTLSFKVDPYLIDAQARIQTTFGRVRTVHIRLLISHPRHARSTDVWFEYSIVNSPNTIWLPRPLEATNATCIRGDFDEVQAFLGTRGILTLRLDVFYGMKSVFDEPFDKK